MRSYPTGSIDLITHASEQSAAARLAEEVDTRAVGPYRGYAEVVARLVEMVSDRGEVQRIGSSAQNSPLFCVQVGKRGSKRVSVVLAGLHAMEWIGVEVGLDLLGRLLDSPPADRRVLFFPLVNVDGFRRAERDLRTGRRRFVRANAEGVDLNRNWPTHWRRRRLVGRRWLRFLGTAGPGPRSTPEIDAICTRLDAEVEGGSRIERALSLHSFGRAILHPYGGQWRPPDDVAAHRSLAASVRTRLGSHYRVVQVSRWFPGAFCFGMELDDLHARYGATALLVECSSGGFRLRSPASWVHPFRWFNPPERDRVVGELGAALEPLVRGQA